MIEQFFIRNLHKTTKFLCKVGLATAVQPLIEPEVLLAISYQNGGDYRQAHASLQCAESRGHSNKIVFCTCCGSVVNFIRNNSLLQYRECKEIVVSKGFRGDPFTDFIKAKATKSIEALVQIIEEVPLFWEAVVELSQLADRLILIEGPLAGYFYMLLKIEKDIELPECMKECKRDSVIDCKTDCRIEKRDANLYAAYLYCSGDSEQALVIFNRIVADDNIKCNGVDDNTQYSINTQYMDIAALILFNQNSPRLQSFVELLCIINPDTPETLTAMGIYKTSIGAHSDAKHLFKKALKLHTSSDVLCYLAHAHIHLKEKEEAVSVFMRAMSHNSNNSNYRIIYTVAHGFFLLDMLDRSLHYCCKAAERKSDGTIWKLMGRIYAKRSSMNGSVPDHISSNIHSAMQCFEKALNLKEHDALLYMAELHKKNGCPEKAAELYSTYVQVGSKNKGVVAKYLVEYYEEIGDVEKSNFYRCIYI